MARFVRQLDSQKWGSFTQEEGVHVMTLADMDLALPEGLKQAIVSRLQAANNFTYKDVSAEWLKSITQWYGLRHLKPTAPALQPEQILESPSLLNIISLLLERLTVPGDGILLLTPVYNYYDRISRYLRRRPVESRLHCEPAGRQFRYDINFTDLAAKAKQCKIMIFCNPHNPSGRVWSQREVEKVVAICQQNSILIISDEILCDLSPAKHLRKFYSMANCSYPRTIVCNSISKAFNAGSLRAGYAIVRDPLVRSEYSEMVRQLGLQNNEFGMLCTELFYSPAGLEWIDHSLAIIGENYAYLLQRLEGTRLLVSDLEAAYIITVNFEGYLSFLQRWFAQQGAGKGQSRHMVAFFLKQNAIRGIEMIYGNVHGVLTDIRLAIAIETDLFRKFADKLRACVLELQFQYRNIGAKL